jgi:hypothetical protein
MGEFLKSLIGAKVGSFSTIVCSGIVKFEIVTANPIPE